MVVLPAQEVTHGRQPTTYVQQHWPPALAHPTPPHRGSRGVQRGRRCRGRQQGARPEVAVQRERILRRVVPCPGRGTHEPSAAGSRHCLLPLPWGSLSTIKPQTITFHKPVASFPPLPPPPGGGLATPATPVKLAQNQWILVKNPKRVGHFRPVWTPSLGGGVGAKNQSGTLKN